VWLPLNLSKFDRIDSVSTPQGDLSAVITFVIFCNRRQTLFF
jgi:hypothetical protein